MNTRYEIDEETMELYDKDVDFLYPLNKRMHNGDLLWEDFYGAYICGSKNNEGLWSFDNNQKEYKEWYGTEIAIGGYIVKTIPATINQVYKYLSNSLRDDLIDEYFSNIAEYSKKGDQPFPKDDHWIACYAVTGASEGHYVHVDIIKDNKRSLLYLAKTFKGMDHAWKIAARLGELLSV